MKELIVKDYPKSTIAESLKNINTNLIFSSVKKKIKNILITSSISGEGKSFTSANLAATYAGPNEKVLLVDCDLRKGRQKELFGIKDFVRPGLSNLLIDDNWQKNLVNYIYTSRVTGLDVITNGTLPPNPNVLLESAKIERVFEELRKKYDVIILDAPPVGGLSDALVLSRLADVVIIVAFAGRTPSDLLENTKTALQNVNANIAGVILNGVHIKSNKYYKGYYSQS